MKELVELLRELADALEQGGECENCDLKNRLKYTLQNRVGKWQGVTCLSPVRGRARTRALCFATPPAKPGRKTIPISVENEPENPLNAVQPRTVSQQVVIKSGRIRQQKLPKVKVAEPEPEPPPSVKPVFDYWLAHGLRMPRSNTKASDQCVRSVQAILRGTFFKNFDSRANRKYDYEEIRSSIANFALAATNMEFEPVNKEHLLKLDINGFFFSPFAKVVKSWFLRCLETPPRVSRGHVEAVEDSHPGLTDLIMRKFYNRRVPENLSQSTLNTFISAAQKMHDFYHHTYLRNVFMSPEPIGQVVDYMLECLANTFGRASIKPANCASDWTFTQCLPDYLSEINAWDSGSIDIESD